MYWDILKRTGGFFNASTSWDFTTYYTTAHKDQLELMMRLEAWRMMNTVGGVTPEVFNTEREVVRNELRQRWETTAGNKMFDLLFDSLYPVGHPLRRPIGGTHESLTASKLEHAQAFVKEHYRPDNATITIVGDVDTEEVKRLLGTWPAELLFGPEGPRAQRSSRAREWASGSAPPVPAAGQHQAGPAQGADRPRRCCCWPGRCRPGCGARTRWPTFAASRLNLALGALDLREEDDIMGAGAFSMALADSSVMVMMADLRPWADPEKARKRLLDVLVHAWGSVDPDERALGAPDLTSCRPRPPAGVLGVLAAAARGRSAAHRGRAVGVHGGHRQAHLLQGSLEELASIKAGEVSDFAVQVADARAGGGGLLRARERQDPAGLRGGGGGRAGAGGQAGGESASHDIGRGIASNAARLTSEKLLQMVKSPELARCPSSPPATGWRSSSSSGPSRRWRTSRLGLRGGNASHAAGGRGQPGRQPGPAPLPGIQGAERGGRLAGRWGGADTRPRCSARCWPATWPTAWRRCATGSAAWRSSDEVFLHLPRLAAQAGRVFDKTSVYPDFIAKKWFNAQLYPGAPLRRGGLRQPRCS